MAQNKRQIQALLADARATPRHRLGQNFMIDANLVRIVADAGMIASGDLVIEVGPGTGTLTEELLSKAQVLAVEIDHALADLLRKRFASAKNFELIEGDALAAKHALDDRLLDSIRRAKSAGRTVRLVSNLPYNIASPLLIELLIAGVDVLACTVQREVAGRLRAAPNSPDYGTLSIMAQLLARVEMLRTLPPQAFWPRPKIDSALVRLTRQDRLGNRTAELSAFVRRIFSARRKTLRNAVALASDDAENLLTSVGISPKDRPESVSPENFLRLFRSFSEKI
ncbi:MAG: 16S rRNA (adenine(1518)-N(6)/adenine(1519)-N(6))-dimethyltransferase RsmA [Tepidisphaeraceae bacterium]